MSNYYSDRLMAQMQYEERLHQAELDRLARRVAKAQGKPAPMRRVLQQVVSLGAVFIGLRLHP